MAHLFHWELEDQRNLLYGVFVSGGRVTVLWTLDGAPEALPAEVGGIPIAIVHVDPRALVPAVGKALGQGPVVAVVADPSRAPDALGLGVDEVVCADDVRNAVSWQGTLRSAVLRARARDLRDHFAADTAQVEGDAPLRLLSAAIAHEINNPLASAWLNSEVLRDALDPLIAAFDEVLRLAGRGEDLPLEQLRRLVAIRASAPPGDELRLIVEDIQAALGRAAQIIGRMSALTALDSTDEKIDLTEVVLEIVSFVRAEIERTADLHVEVSDKPCLVEMPRGWAMQITAALLTNAVEAISEQDARRGKLELTLLPHEDVALIEITDNGVGMTAEVRRHALDPFFTTRRPGAPGLGLTMAANYARRAGGELIVESQPGVGTTMRVFLPLAGALKPPPPAEDTN